MPTWASLKQWGFILFFIKTQIQRDTHKTRHVVNGCIVKKLKSVLCVVAIVLAAGEFMQRATRLL